MLLLELVEKASSWASTASTRFLGLDCEVAAPEALVFRAQAAAGPSERQSDAAFSTVA
jgi:hypothetical protein